MLMFVEWMPNFSESNKSQMFWWQKSRQAVYSTRGIKKPNFADCHEIFCNSNEQYVRRPNICGKIMTVTWMDAIPKNNQNASQDSSTKSPNLGHCFYQSTNV